jgi:hypothetical protein
MNLTANLIEKFEFEPIVIIAEPELKLEPCDLEPSLPPN